MSNLNKELIDLSHTINNITTYGNYKECEGKIDVIRKHLITDFNRDFVESLRIKLLSFLSLFISDDLYLPC